MATQEGGRVQVGVDERLAPWAPEVAFVLRTLLVASGAPHVLRWLRADADPASVDLYYGPPREGPGARVHVEWNGLGFDTAQLGALEPQGCTFDEDLVLIELRADAAAPAPAERARGGLHLRSDLVLACYWLLVGAREPRYARDRLDNLLVGESGLVRHGLLERPAVSRFAAALRAQWRRAGIAVEAPAWAPAPGRAGFALTHDVDYPQILRSLEWLRWLARHGPVAPPPALFERDAYWRFDDWVALADQFGTRPTFYFMARRGSPLRFALGDPDAFYEIEHPRFRALFSQLRDQGCEIGLHASFRAAEDPQRFAAERRRLERLSGGPVRGNRHHYWRLAPDAPHASWRQQAAAGLRYDSSLAFEMRAGFRRGICQPFRPFDPERRETLPLVVLPPAWMDDHYDGRWAGRRAVAHANAPGRAVAGPPGAPADASASPADHAAGLLREVAACGGIAVVDYHVRGMNRAVFPRWGAFLERLLRERLPPGMSGVQAGSAVDDFERHEAALLARSRDGLAAGERW